MPSDEGQALYRAALAAAAPSVETEIREAVILATLISTPAVLDDTADALGIAPGTVKSRLSRASGRLRTVIEADFPELGERRLA